VRARPQASQAWQAPSACFDASNVLGRRSEVSDHGICYALHRDTGGWVGGKKLSRALHGEPCPILRILLDAVASPTDLVLPCVAVVPMARVCGKALRPMTTILFPCVSCAK